MPQERLFNVAPDSLALSAVHVLGEGWRLTLSTRTSGEEWSDRSRATYSHLSTAELLDVIDSELLARLVDLYRDPR